MHLEASQSSQRIPNSPFGSNRVERPWVLRDWSWRAEQKSRLTCPEACTTERNFSFCFFKAAQSLNLYHTCNSQSLFDSHSTYSTLLIQPLREMQCFIYLFFWIEVQVLRLSLLGFISVFRYSKSLSSFSKISVIFSNLISPANW